MQGLFVPISDGPGKFKGLCGGASIGQCGHSAPTTEGWPAFYSDQLCGEYEPREEE